MKTILSNSATKAVALAAVAGLALFGTLPAEAGIFKKIKDKVEDKVVKELLDEAESEIKDRYDLDWDSLDDIDEEKWDKAEADFEEYSNKEKYKKYGFHYVKFDTNGGTFSYKNKKSRKFSDHGFYRNTTIAYALVIKYGTYDKIGTLPANPTRKGYTFSGWYLDGTSTKVTASYKPKANVRVVAKWKANAYTVKFDKNGGTGKAMANKKYTYGKKYTLPANTYKRSGYTFLGWATDKKATKAKYSDKQKNVKNLSAKANGTVTLYAVWKQNTYTVKFDANGGTGSVTAQTIKTGVNTALSANKFTRTGYEFLGWSTKKNATTATYSNKAKVKDLAKANKSVTLYAVWSLPVWAKGTFIGSSGYWSPITANFFDGVGVATVSSMGALSGTIKLEKSGGGVATVAFSAPAFSTYYSSRSIDQLLDLLDYDEEDDPYGIAEDVEDGVAPASVKVYIYKAVSFKLPDESTPRTADVALMSWTYDGKTIRGALGLSLDSEMEMCLNQNLFLSKQVTLPQFSGTPKKSFNVSAAAQYSDSWEGQASDLTKVEVTFGANGALTVAGYNGTAKKWTTSATLQLYRYLDGAFDAGADFLTPDGTQLWFDCELKPGKNGKVDASGITFRW